MIEQTKPYVISPPEPASEERIVCPVCRLTDKIDKVSSIIRLGSGQVYLPGMPGTYRFENQLSSELRMPEPPRTPSLRGLAKACLISWIVGGLLLGGIALLRMQPWLDLPASPLQLATIAIIALLGVLIPAIAAVRYWRQRVDASRLTPGWLAAQDRWSRLYYCTRDDVIFVDDEERAQTPARLHDVLYPQRSNGS